MSTANIAGTISHGAVKLGMIPSKPDKRDLMMAKYINKAKLPTAKTVVDYYSRLHQIGMMGNDQIGDCTIAGLGHGVQVWSEYAQLQEDTIPDKTITDLYWKLTGGDDTGLMERDVLKYVNKEGFCGIEIDGFVRIDPKDHNIVRMATQLCGFVYIGVGLPVTAQDQTWWHVVDPSLTGNSALGSWGGHCVIVPGYNMAGLTNNLRGDLALITWAKVMGMDMAFWDAYVMECWALLSKEWISKTGANPDGILWKDLINDVEKCAAA